MSVHNQVGKKGRKKIDKERKKIDVREKENRKRKKERKIDQERKKERKNSLLEKPRLICKEERERERLEIGIENRYSVKKHIDKQLN